MTPDRSSSALPRWLLLSVQAPPAGEEILLVEALRRVGARAVEREGERYLALIPGVDDPDRLLRDAEAAIRTGTSLVDPRLAWRWQSRDEWADAWGRAVAPLRIGERLVVAPLGSDPTVEEDDLVIRLVPGFGFGTAEHPTTRGCLRLLEPVVTRGDRIADIGSGSGILSIAAALLGAAEVVAFEADRHACATARENMAQNGVAERVEVRIEKVKPEGLGDDERFTGITANLQAEILLPILSGIARSLTPGGWIVVSGLHRGERADVLSLCADADLQLEAEEVDEGWWSARLRRTG